MELKNVAMAVGKALGAFVAWFVLLVRSEISHSLATDLNQLAKMHAI